MTISAEEPKTDRELLLMINGHTNQLTKDVKEIKNRLADTIDADFCDRQHVDITKRLSDYSKRIRGLENWRWYVMGGFVVVIILINFVLQIRK
jgi:hypothetical protein